MKNFIRVQYNLYLSGKSLLTLEVIKTLASTYMTEEEQLELFGVE